MATDKEKLFRKVSLDRLSSPEQLDQLMQITSPKGWLALLTIGACLLYAVIWGFVGVIPEKVSGQGMLMKSGGVVDILLATSGKITDIKVVSGDVIKKGEIIARIDQPEIILGIRDLEERLSELQLKKEKLTILEGGLTELQEEQLLKQRESLKERISALQERARLLEEMKKKQRQLLKQGLITETTVINTQNDQNSVKDSIAVARNEINQLGVSEAGSEKEQHLERLNLEAQIADVERQIASQKASLELSSKLMSPYSGRVVEIRKKISDIAQPGQVLMSVELFGKEIKELEAVMFFPASEGKKIRTGMEMQISPSTVKREEFGSLLAKVTSVSDYPSTREGIMKILGNEQLVTDLTQNSVAIKVVADLIPDSNTFSGYRWSSSQGPPVKIYSGTLAASTVIVRRNRPISLVMPFFRKQTGIYDLF